MQLGKLKTKPIELFILTGGNGFVYFLVYNPPHTLAHLNIKFRSLQHMFCLLKKRSLLLLFLFDF